MDGSAGSVGTELEFLDGKRVVDNAYMPMIRSATGGSTERFTFRDAMAMASREMERQVLRQAQRDVIRKHFSGS